MPLPRSLPSNLDSSKRSLIIAKIISLLPESKEKEELLSQLEPEDLFPALRSLALSFDMKVMEVRRTGRFSVAGTLQLSNGSFRTFSSSTFPDDDLLYESVETTFSKLANE